jgi:hypothetical protein
MCFLLNVLRSLPGFEISELGDDYQGMIETAGAAIKPDKEAEAAVHRVDIEKSPRGQVRGAKIDLRCEGRTCTYIAVTCHKVNYESGFYEEFHKHKTGCRIPLPIRCQPR